MARNPNGRFAPGTSGNPNGRPPKERALTHILEQRADRERLVDALLNLAYSGDLPALMFVFLRFDGAPETAEDVRARWDAFEDAVMTVVAHLAHTMPGASINVDDPLDGADRALYELNGGSADAWQVAADRFAVFLAARQSDRRTNGHAHEPIPRLEDAHGR